MESRNPERLIERLHVEAVFSTFLELFMPIRTTTPPKSADHYKLTTDEFADQRRTKTQTVRKHYCTRGSYFGIRPLRLPNGKLLWPDGTLEQLYAEQLGQVEIGSNDSSKADHATSKATRYAYAPGSHASVGQVREA